MGKTTRIGWTDSTVNFWWGCTKVGPGCDHCYAEQWSKKTSKVGIWGVGVPRRKIKGARALMQKLNAGPRFPRDPGTWRGYDSWRRPRVFVQSMSDLFDLEVPTEWFDEAWSTIHACDRLAVQIVTKRVSVIEKRLAGFGGSYLDPMPTSDRARHHGWPRHAGLIITVVDQDEANRDVPRALALKAKLGIPWLGLSVEPQLGWIVAPARWFPGVDWVICGGESKQGKDHVPRPFDLRWPRSLLKGCETAGAAFFMKQLGSRPIVTKFDDNEAFSDGWHQWDGPLGPWSRAFKDRAGADPSEWPADLRVQQFPEALR